jgi:hypothetical protein
MSVLVKIIYVYAYDYMASLYVWFIFNLIFIFIVNCKIQSIFPSFRKSKVFLYNARFCFVVFLVIAAFHLILLCFFDFLIVQ